METLIEIKKDKEFVPDFMYIQRLEEYCEKLEEDIEEANEGEIYWKRRFDDLKHEVTRLKDKLDFIEINQILDNKKTIDIQERDDIVKCPTCNGTGKYIKGDCPTCYGSGEYPFGDPYGDFEN